MGKCHCDGQEEGWIKSFLCGLYRELNDATIKDAFPLPPIDEPFDQLAGSTWFSCLDLNSGYWQVETDPQDKDKTAFTSCNGLFEFNDAIWPM